MVIITMDVAPKDEDTTTKQVIDYYKKYSQNRELPKYFSGTSLSYLPEIKTTVGPETEIKTFVHTDINIVVTTADEIPITEIVEEPIGTSGASSPASNHKLEWDSGADIGYSNFQEKRLRKSSSLPIITDVVKKQAENDFRPITSNAAVIRSESSSSSDGNVKVVLLSCSSSSEYQSDKCADPLELKKVSSSSSSSNANGVVNNFGVSSSSSDSSNKQSLKQFASTLSYLKQKIGLPDAHSTPKNPEERKSNVEENSSTPVAKKSVSSNKKDEIHIVKVDDDSKLVKLKNVSKKLIKKSNVLTLAINEEEVEPKKSQLVSDQYILSATKYLNQKVVNLVVTKPITVECASSSRNLTNKSLQTVTKQSTVAVQTDEISQQELVQAIQVSQRNYNNQSLMYFEYSESDKTSGRSTQTNSDVLESNCDSFEYLPKEPVQVKSGILKKSSSSSSEIISNSQKDAVLPQVEQASSVNGPQTVCESRTSVTEENSSSKDFCLGNLVSAGLLGNVEDDIGKCVYLLQRLLKSKKYDPVTKKRYIKKIIKRITESKYLEESSTSSDLFVPKKLPKIGSSGDKSENLLQSNIPWYPVALDQLKSSPRKKKLAQKIFTQDFVPGQNSSKEEISSAPEIVPINSRDTRKNRFTLTNNEFSVNRGPSTSTEKTNREQNISETDSTSLEKHYESSSTSKSYQNWREDKTLSERILEKQSDKSYSSNGNGDCVVKFADKEREFQIDWIKNEISHLGKLKGLLEKPGAKRKKLPNTKNTNVYTVSNENAAEPKHKRNYVIETIIGAQSSSEMNFRLDGQVYTVQEYLNSKKKREPKKSKPVTGNIEVVSSDGTTNIKVTTFCEECKRSPCACYLPEYDEGCQCNREGAEHCGSDTCLCGCDSHIKVSSAALLEQAASQYIKGTDYVSSSSSGSYEDCTCYVCKKYPCTCDRRYKELEKVVSTNSNNGMSGTFIPIAPHKPAAVKFSTCPPTCRGKIGGEGNFTSTNIGRDVIGEAASKIVKFSTCPPTCSGNIGREENSTSTNTGRDVIGEASSNIVKFSTCPPSCKGKIGKEQNSTSTNTGRDVIGEAGSKIVSSHNEQTSTSYWSLQKVFENCACTQTDCTCDFVEKLLSRFTKTNIFTSTKCDNKCQQTEKSTDTNAGLQTHVETVNENQQISPHTSDDKSLQTEKCAVNCDCKNIDSSGQKQQIIVKVKDIEVQTHVSKIQDNFQNVEIQTNPKVKDQKLQTSDSLFLQEKFVKKNEGSAPKVTSVVDEVEIKNTEPMQTVESVEKSSNNVDKQDAVLHSPDKSSPGHVVEKTASRENLEGGVEKEGKSSTKQVDNTSNNKQFVGSSEDGKHKTENEEKSSTKHVDETSNNKHFVGSSDDGKLQATPEPVKPTQGQSDSSHATSSKNSSHYEKDQVLCVCCCTQTETKSKSKSKKEKTKVQMDSSGHSDKENAKYKSDTVTTNSITYEICPSILVTSSNNTSQFVSDGSSSKPNFVLCFCCKKKHTSDKISVLGSKTENYPICCNCLAQRPILTAVCYAGPEDNCPCSKPSTHTLTKTDASEDFKKTTTDSNDMEEFCRCTKPYQFKNSKYCSYCQSKLRNTAKSKNGIAYTLTLESDCLNKIRRKIKKAAPLEEIVLKVSSPSSKKKCKDKENVTKRDKEGRTKGKGRTCCCGNVVCTRNCHMHGISNKHKKDSGKRGLTLQEYLQKNRPDFIESAESRRNIVITSRGERELGLADAKLKFVEENAGQDSLKKRKKLFTEQEMKEITKRNYKKLPEVKKRVDNKKEQRLRDADRFIVDVFARKIQHSVLKGKSNFPIDSNVICLPKTCNC